MRGIRILCIIWLSLMANGASAQLVEKVLHIIEKDSLNPASSVRADSDSTVSLSAVKQELQAARLNEANLRMEVEQLKLASYAADSTKLAQQRLR